MGLNALFGIPRKPAPLVKPAATGAVSISDNPLGSFGRSQPAPTQPKAAAATGDVQPDPNYINGVRKDDPNYDQYGIPKGQTGRVYGAGGTDLGTTVGGSGTITPNGSPKPPATPRPISAYESMMQKRLAGQDPITQNAQQHQDKNVALNNYTAMRSGREQGVQAGFTPGSLQYQRGIDRAESNASQENLAGQDRVNALTRERGTEALNMSHQDELKKDSDIQTLISSVKSPKGQAHLRQVLASGGDVNAEYAKMFGDNGTLGKEWRDETPAETQLQGFKDRVKILHPDWTDEQITAEATKLYGGATGATDAPTETATVQRTTDQLNSTPAGQVDWAKPENKAALDALPDTPLQQFTRNGRALSTFATTNAGKWVKIGGQPFKVQGSIEIGANDSFGAGTIQVLQVQDKNGNTIYLDSEGRERTQ